MRSPVRKRHRLQSLPAEAEHNSEMSTDDGPDLDIIAHELFGDGIQPEEEVNTEVGVDIAEEIGGENQGSDDDAQGEEDGQDHGEGDHDGVELPGDGVDNNFGDEIRSEVECHFNDVMGNEGGNFYGNEDFDEGVEVEYKMHVLDGMAPCATHGSIEPLTRTPQITRLVTDGVQTSTSQRKNLKRSALVMKTRVSKKKRRSTRYLLKGVVP